MDLQTLRTKINEFYLDSKNMQYPNSLLLTNEQYKDLMKETFKVPEYSEIPDGVFITSIEGLQVVFTDDLVEPRVLKM